MASGFDVAVVFLGLVALVPNNDTPSAVSALLVDARGAQYASDGCILPPHKPILLVRAAECSDDGKACAWNSELKRDEFKRDVSASWDLNGRLLDIKTITSRELQGASNIEEGPNLSFEQVGQPTARFPVDPLHAKSTAWIPVLPIADKVNPLCLATPVGRTCPLAARVNLRNGTVQTCRLLELTNARISEGDLISVCPQNRPGMPRSTYALQMGLVGNPGVVFDAPTAMSDGFAVSMSMLDRATMRVEIWMTDLQGSGLRKIVLRPGRGNIEIWVANVPVGDSALDEGFCRTDTVDKHFQLYYHLSKPRQSGSPLPLATRAVPHATNCRGQIQPGQVGGFALCELPLKVPQDHGHLPGDKGACVNGGFAADGAAGSAILEDENP